MTFETTRARRGVRLRLLAAGALAATGLTPLAAQAVGRSGSFESPCADSPTHCFTVTVTNTDPQQPGPGDPGHNAFTLYNMSNGGAGHELNTTWFTFDLSQVFEVSGADPDGAGPITYSLAKVDGATDYNQIRYGNLNVAPEGNATPPLAANFSSFFGGTTTVDVKAWQSNQALSLGNQLKNATGNPSVTYSTTCGGSGVHADESCRAVDKSQPTDVPTDGYLPSSNSFTTPFGAIAHFPGLSTWTGDRFWTYHQTTDQGGVNCPSPVSELPEPVLGTVCTRVFRALPPGFPSDYDAAHPITVDLDYRNSPFGPLRLWFIEDEGDNTLSPLLPSIVPAGIPTVPGDTMARVEDFGNGLARITGLTGADDMRVMNMDLLS
jgi:hypothetical protein